MKRIQLILILLFIGISTFGQTVNFPGTMQRTVDGAGFKFKFVGGLGTFAITDSIRAAASGGGSAGVISFNGRNGIVTPQLVDYSPFYPSLSGSYNNPSWITGLAWSKMTSTPTTLSGYGITDAYPLIGNPSGFLTSFTESDPTVPAYAKSLTGFSVIKTSTDALYEPIISPKNTAFNKNFGTASGTVAEGNDSRINNGQTAFGWGNHALAGYYSATNLPPSQVQNTLSPNSTTLAPSVTAVNNSLNKLNSYRSIIDSIDASNLRNDQSAVIELSGNRVLVAYSHFKTNPDDPGESAIWAAISSDGGVTHGTPYQLIPKISEGSYIPSFYKKSNGNIVCLFYVLTKNTIPYTSSIYRAEYDSDMNVVSAPTSILSGGYTAPASDRIFKDEINNRLIYPYAKLVSGTASSTTSVYEGRILVSSNDGTTWTDNGLSFGSGVVTGAGFGGALEPGIYYDKSKGLVAYFRTLVGSVYASNLTYSGGNYTASTPYSMGIASSNAQVTIKYLPKKDIYLAANMDVLNNDPLDYTLRKRLTLLSSYDGLNWSQTNQIDRVYGTSALNEPTLYFDDLNNRVNIYYSSSPDGNNFDLRNLIIPYGDIYQQYDNPILNQNFLYQKANAKIDGSIEILNNTNDNSLTLKRGGNTGKYALLGFNDAAGVNQAYTGLASDGSNEFTTFSKSQIRNQSGTNSAIIFGNTQPLTPDYVMGVLGKKVLITNDFQDPSYFDNATNYKEALTVEGKATVAVAPTNATDVVRKTELDTKQANLVSGTNIKTINGNSVLGSGDLVISGGASLTLTTTGTSGAATLNTGVTPNVLNIPNYVATDFYPESTEFEGQGTSADKFRLKSAGVSVAKGGTGGSTFTGIIKGNGTSAFSVATPGTDYVVPSTTVAGFPLSANVTLASLTATNTSLTFSGAYNGAAARTVGVNLGNTWVWTGKHTFATPTTSLASFNAPHGTAPTSFTNGDFWTTTAGQFNRINGVTKQVAYTSELPTGTTNYISKFTGSNTIGNSLIFDNGTNIGIGTASPSEKLQVSGNILLTSAVNYIYASKFGSVSGDISFELGSSGNSLKINGGNADFAGKATVASAPTNPTDVVRLQDIGNLKAVTTKTANYTITTSDSFIVCETAASAFTLTLPPASTTAGNKYYITNVSGQNVTIATTGGANEIRNTTANVNALIITSSTYGTSVLFASNGTNYYKIY